MENRIQRISISERLLTPTEAEVWISVFPKRLTSITQVRGRLMGPRCAYSTTVEVAYPLREQLREYETAGDPHFCMRVIIPEPNLWDPVSPFLYQGPLELWQSKELCDQRTIIRGLRALKLGPRGLNWNGKALVLRGVEREEDMEPEALQLRQLGCNALLAPVLGKTAALWEIATRLGFLMIGRIDSKDAVRLAHGFQDHPCCLGWLFTPAYFSDKLVQASQGALGHRGQLIGVEMKEPPADELPKWLSFLACSEDLLPRLEHVKLPKIVYTKEWPTAPDVPPRILGWVRQ